MIRVKVCGITRPADAKAIAALGVDYLGFIFCKTSPRFIEPDRAAEIIAGLDRKRVGTVGVFVDETVDGINGISQTAGLDMAQVYGDLDPEALSGIRVPVVKVFSVASAADLEDVRRFESKAAYLMFDTRTRGMHGGTGRTFDWTLISRFNPRNAFFLAGGLNEENIAAACDIGPFAVDLNSGVEISPGVKDPARVARVLERMGRWRT